MRLMYILLLELHSRGTSYLDAMHTLECTQGHFLSRRLLICIDANVSRKRRLLHVTKVWRKSSCVTFEGHFDVILSLLIIRALII